MNAPPHPPLQLHSMPDPDNRDSSVSIFGGWQAACEHICNHVLVSPECEAWILVAPDINRIVDLSNADERWRAAQESSKPEGGFAQPLYDEYVQAIRVAAADAMRLGWHITEESITVLIGTSGLVAVIEGQVRTAFLPGQGDPLNTLASQRTGVSRESSNRDLPSQRGMRGGRNGEYSGQKRPHLTADHQRVANRSHDEQLYYAVFRPAMQFIRSRQNRCRDITGRVLRGGDYALLKGVLPPMSRLKLPDWQQLRSARSSEQQQQ